MKTIIKISVLWVMMIFWVNNAFAGNVTPDEYNITIKKVELRDQATSSFVLVKEADLTFNIASASAGAIAGSYISGAAIPEGTYDQVKVTISRNLGVRAADGTYYTTTTQQAVDVPVLGSATVVTISTTATDYNAGDEGTISIPALVSGVDASAGTFVDTQTLSTPIVVKKGLTKNTTIKFDVINKATFDTVNLICYLQAPGVSVE